jgi:hypothetical protein
MDIDSVLDTSKDWVEDEQFWHDISFLRDDASLGIFGVCNFCQQMFDDSTPIFTVCGHTICASHFTELPALCPCCLQPLTSDDVQEDFLLHTSTNEENLVDSQKGISSDRVKQMIESICSTVFQRFPVGVPERGASKQYFDYLLSQIQTKTIDRQHAILRHNNDMFNFLSRAHCLLNALYFLNFKLWNSADEDLFRRYCDLLVRAVDFLIATPLTKYTANVYLPVFMPMPKTVTTNPSKDKYVALRPLTTLASSMCRSGKLDHKRQIELPQCHHTIVHVDYKTLTVTPNRPATCAPSGAWILAFCSGQFAGFWRIDATMFGKSAVHFVICSSEDFTPLLSISNFPSTVVKRVPAIDSLGNLLFCWEADKLVGLRLVYNQVRKVMTVAEINIFNRSEAASPCHDLMWSNLLGFYCKSSDDTICAIHLQNFEYATTTLTPQKLTVQCRSNIDGNVWMLFSDPTSISGIEILSATPVVSAPVVPGSVGRFAFDNTIVRVNRIESTIETNLHQRSLKLFCDGLVKKGEVLESVFPNDEGLLVCLSGKDNKTHRIIQLY